MTDTNLFEFTTPDSTFAAYIQTVGWKLKRLENAHKNGRRFFFVFEMPQSDWDKLYFDFFTETEGSRVPAQQYSKTIKSMDALLRNHLNSSRNGR
jgi:hypothetical protein